MTSKSVSLQITITINITTCDLYFNSYKTDQIDRVSLITHEGQIKQTRIHLAAGSLINCEQAADEF